MCANALNKLFWLLNEKILLNKNQNPFLCIKLFIWDAISFRLTNTSLKIRSTKENRETLRHAMFKCLFVCLSFRCSILIYVNSLSFLIHRGIFLIDDTLNQPKVFSYEAEHVISICIGSIPLKMVTWNSSVFPVLVDSSSIRKSLIYNNLFRFEKKSREIIWQHITQFFNFGIFGLMVDFNLLHLFAWTHICHFLQCYQWQ